MVKKSARKGTTATAATIRFEDVSVTAAKKSPLHDPSSATADGEITALAVGILNNSDPKTGTDGLPDPLTVSPSAPCDRVPTPYTVARGRRRFAALRLLHTWQSEGAPADVLSDDQQKKLKKWELSPEWAIVRPRPADIVDVLLSNEPLTRDPVGQCEIVATATCDLVRRGVPRDRVITYLCGSSPQRSQTMRLRLHAGTLLADLLAASKSKKTTTEKRAKLRAAYQSLTRRMRAKKSKDGPAPIAVKAVAGAQRRRERKKDPVTLEQAVAALLADNAGGAKAPSTKRIKDVAVYVAVGADVDTTPALLIAAMRWARGLTDEPTPADGEWASIVAAAPDLADG